MNAAPTAGTGIIIGGGGGGSGSDHTPSPVPGEEYITTEELKMLAPCDVFETADAATLNVLIASGRELIDAHCGKHFDGTVPALVKTVNANLARALAADPTKQSENIDGYGYSNNTAALNQILARLDLLPADGGVSPSEAAKEVKARVI